MGIFNKKGVVFLSRSTTGTDKSDVGSLTTSIDFLIIKHLNL